MKKIILGAVLALIGAASAFAQNTDYNRTEVFAGYSNNQVDTNSSGAGIGNGFDDRSSFHGFNASTVYNVNRYFGVKADVSGTYRNQRFSQTVGTGASTITASFDTKNSLYNFLGGVQVKDNASEKRVKPFAHALVGVGYGRTKVGNVNCPSGAFCASLPTLSDSATGLAGAFGGGLDIKVNKKIDIRAIQVDYNPIRFDGETSHNVRIGVGIVIK